jgi:predicted metalloprotease with PDZ domain
MTFIARETRRNHLRFAIGLAALIALATLAPHPIRAQAKPLDPSVYTVRIPNPSSKTFNVDVAIPTEKRDSVILMMAIWSPGMYVLQNYTNQVSAFTASAPDGTALDVTKPKASRWIVKTGGRPSITVSYTLAAPRGSNLSNGVTDSSLVIVGPATYITLVEQAHRAAQVRLELPPTWKPAVTSLDAAPDGKPNHFVAPDYDILADSPILAGVHMSSADFTVGGARHTWAYLGDAEWDARNAAAAMTPLVQEHLRFWGFLPFKKYVFLNIITGGNGGSGIEHLNSVAITGGAKEPTTPEARFRQASFVSHEYFHAMNVKRLRPVELGPFDYENSPVTTGLWIAEGLTSYFGDLLAERAGLGGPREYLALTSKHITDLQNSPGRLSQTLEQSSSQMFERLPRNQTVDYYVKGPVVGLILDAHIRRMTDGKKSMDDVIRLEYKRWSGEHGYTADQFNQTASDAVGFDLKPLLRTLIATTNEVDYTEMLDWFGLRFVPNDDPTKAWTLEVRPDATPAQTAHFAAFMAHSSPP